MRGQYEQPKCNGAEGQLGRHVGVEVESDAGVAHPSACRRATPSVALHHADLAARRIAGMLLDELLAQPIETAWLSCTTAGSKSRRAAKPGREAVG